MRQPRPVVIAGRREEDLRLVLEPAKGLAVDDAIAIALKRRADRILGFGAQPAACVGALGRLRRENVALPPFELLPDGMAPAHRSRSYQRYPARKLVPWSSGPTPKSSASVCPRSAERLPHARSTPALTDDPPPGHGTCSRE